MHTTYALHPAKHFHIKQAYPLLAMVQANRSISRDQRSPQNGVGETRVMRPRTHDMMHTANHSVGGGKTFLFGHFGISSSSTSFILCSLTLALAQMPCLGWSPFNDSGGVWHFFHLFSPTPFVLLRNSVSSSRRRYST